MERQFKSMFVPTNNFCYWLKITTIYDLFDFRAQYRFLRREYGLYSLAQQQADLSAGTQLYSEYDCRPLMDVNCILSAETELNCILLEDG